MSSGSPRIDLSHDGQINDFFTHGRSFSLRRTGDARYELTTLTASEEIVIEMWTTKRFGLKVD